jgi:hypothetical protein
MERQMFARGGYVQRFQEADRYAHAGPVAPMPPTDRAQLEQMPMDQVMGGPAVRD